MKKGIICLAVVLGLVSCNKYEPTPLQNLTIDKIFDPSDVNGDLAKQALSDIYSYMPDGFNRVNGDMLDGASGDAIPSRTNRTVEYYTNGRLDASNNPDDCWANSYKAIRAVNLFLANVDVVPVDPTGPTKKYWKAEARFVRALAYFEMLKRYGGVPLIGDQILTLDNNLQIPRNTYADCVTYIVSECDAIKTLLRPEPSSELGRITRGVAIALKARTLLYAASPLYNGGGVGTDPVKIALEGYPTYDATRWNLALAAYQELINLHALSLASTFAGAFTSRSSNEVILAKQRGKTYDIETNNGPIGYTQAVAYGYTSPTQELVDAFPMNNGLAITDPTSGYDPTNPYNKRDPRLSSTVFYNGIAWLSRPVELFEGGRDKPGGSAVQTRTGYYMKKFMADFSTATAYSNQDHNFIIFRYGEVLLAYAECLNETGNTAAAYTQLIAIRKRAGIAAGTNSLYGLKAGMSQSDMRTAIQNERRIECAFEEQRFWDIRRWKLASTLLNGTLHGVSITQNTGGGLTYTPTAVSTVTFADKFYNMPLPNAEVITDRNLIQNEGW